MIPCGYSIFDVLAVFFIGIALGLGLAILLIHFIQEPKSATVIQRIINISLGRFLPETIHIVIEESNKEET